MQERQSLSQPLLSPASIELTPAQAEILDAGWEWITGYGFAVEPFGGGYLLRAVPAILSGEAPETALADVLDLAALQGPAARRREDIMAASIACHASVRAGKALTPPEMTALLEQLEQAPNPHTCPPRPPHNDSLQFLPDGTGIRPPLIRRPPNTPPGQYAAPFI